MPRKKGPAGEPPPSQADPILPAVHPAVEDHATPATSLPFPIAGVGASAGGLEAFTALLRALPPDTGMAFVLIQHLSPTHESMLSDILKRATKMGVREVTDEMPVEPNHVYVIPPGKSLVLANGHLQLSPRMERGLARPIDTFMRSLAEEHGHKAIGVILSGSGNDGTLGVEEIKGAGGITFAQDDSAEHTSMPRSALASGTVDFVLPADEIGRELGRIARHPYIGPALDAGTFALKDNEVAQTLEMIRLHTAVDFSSYKRNTIHRRITRRLVLHKIEKPREYVRFLQANPAEIDALYQDILISVTSFFRNPESYEALKATVFPRITEERNRGDQIRVWALGCSTGEEAYSLAIAFTEYLEQSGRRAAMQVFATDLNAAGVEKARSGIYGKGIGQDVTPERLRRFFVEVDGTYRVSKDIRDMCIFARQNVLADPPFSRIDLVACRNMLIYLDPVLQQRLIPLLHYALRSDGYLWLGQSETIGAYRDLFELIDPKAKIYAKKASQRLNIAVPGADTRREREARVHLPMAPPPPDPQKEADRILLARYAPPGVVVTEELEILQFRGDTSPYLSPAPGRASLSLLKMVREGLMVAVRGAIQRARREDLPVREERLRVNSNGGWREVDVVVMPLKGNSVPTGSMLILFEEPAAAAEARAKQIAADLRPARELPPPADGAEKEIARLKQELTATRDYLQSVIEQQEAANEELQSANEEVQSANEELQSINEELETSKEEIQSANEELATVNDELQNRNMEVSQSNNDLVNLLGSVQMPIVMLGPDLRIRRFTPAAEKVFNLIPADIGRSIADIKRNLAMDDLEALVGEVIESVSMREREVRDRNGRWYSLRIRPYRTLENKIDGAVVVLVDVDALKRTEQAMRESEVRLEVLANTASALIWVNDLHGSRFVNRAFEDFVGVKEAEIIRRVEPGEFVHPDDRAAFDHAYQEAMRRKQPFEARFRFRRGDGSYRWMKALALPSFSPAGSFLGYVGCSFDISDLKEEEGVLRELDRGKNEFLAMLAHELRNPLSGVRNASRLLSETRDQRIIDQAREIIDRQTSHMVRMIDELLDVSRISHGKVQLKPQPTDLAAVLRRAVEATADERNANEQALELALPDGPLWVRGDPMRLEQIFCNLLNNSARFTPRAGGIRLSADRDGVGGRAMVRIRDNGVGIDPALLPRIFDLFVQGERPSDRARTGIGLGLTLARRLVDLHEGTIEAYSAGKGTGSEFVVRLPLLREAEIPRQGERPGIAQRRSIEPRRVLIVDDNRDSAESLRLIFAMAGHDVRAVHDGASAEPTAASFQPHVVLLDISLPDMDGYQVARQMRADPRTADALIVAVTGYGRTGDMRRSRDAGIDEHMTKPIDPDALMEMMARGRRVGAAEKERGE